MNSLNRPRPQSPTPINRESRIRDGGRTTTSTVSPELISEAVIASYIHDISTRHSHGAAMKRIRAAVAGEQR